MIKKEDSNGTFGLARDRFHFSACVAHFWPQKLPELGRNIGKALTEFRRASSELRATFDREMANIERETQGIKDEAHKLTGDLNNSYYDNNHYNNNHDDYGYSYDGYSYPDYTSETSSDSPEHKGNPDAHAESATASPRA